MFESNEFPLYLCTPNQYKHIHAVLYLLLTCINDVSDVGLVLLSYLLKDLYSANVVMFE